MRNPLIYLLFCLALPFSATADLETEVYFVHSSKAPLWVEPSFQARQVMVVPRGQRVEKVAAKGGWLHVRIDRHQGWMLKMMLCTHPPVQMSSEQQQDLESLSLRARRRPSSFSTTAAARGLREKRQRFSSKLDMDFDALAKMEGWRVDEQSAMEFLKKVRNYEDHP